VLVAQHHGDDAGEIRLVRQHLQVKHQLDMRFPIGRDSHRVIDERHLLVALFFRDLDAPLDAADGIQVLG